MSSQINNPKEYSVSVRTNNVEEAIASVADALYALVEEALTSHEDHEAEECEFETFARDVLAVLSRHADHVSAGGLRWDEQDDIDSHPHE